MDDPTATREITVPQPRHRPALHTWTSTPLRTHAQPPAIALAAGAPASLKAAHYVRVCLNPDNRASFLKSSWQLPVELIERRCLFQALAIFCVLTSHGKSWLRMFESRLRAGLAGSSSLASDQRSLRRIRPNETVSSRRTPILILASETCGTRLQGTCLKSRASQA